MNTAPAQPSLNKACAVLSKRCGIIRRILRETGSPTWRARARNYQGLARVMIEQQLSVASANAILARVKEATGGLQPRTLLAQEDQALRELGLSRPKIRYLKVLADDVLSKRFSFVKLRSLADQEASGYLQTRLGVGPWTAAVYLLFCEARQDLWPRGDVALLAAHQMAGGSFERSAIADFDAWADAHYAPYRGTAAHILWGKLAHERGTAPL